MSWQLADETACCSLQSRPKAAILRVLLGKKL